MANDRKANSAVFENRSGTQLWQAYLKSPGERRHEALWTHYQPLVGHIASRFNEKMGDTFELTALVCAGNVGLLDAIAEYNPAATTALFESIAVPMIRGAMARSLTVQRSKEKYHVLRLELAEAIAKPREPRPIAMPLQISLKRLRGTSRASI